MDWKDYHECVLLQQHSTQSLKKKKSAGIACIWCGLVVGALFDGIRALTETPKLIQ